MKHNKKRNTAFLYESLIKELTKSIVRKENIRKEKINYILQGKIKDENLGRFRKKHGNCKFQIQKEK